MVPCPWPPCCRAPPPPSVTVAPHHFRFDGDCGGDDCTEEILHWVLDQGGRGNGVVAIVMAGVEIVAMDIAMADARDMGPRYQWAHGPIW